MSNDVAVRGPQSALAIADGQTGFTPAQVSALEQLGVAGATEGDLAVFFHQATRTGLDPFARQIYLIGRNEKKSTKVNGQWVDTWSMKFTIQTGIDGFRLIARRAADRAHETLSYEDTQWCGPDGRWRDSWPVEASPVAARTVVLRNGNRFPAVAHFREYAQSKNNGGLTSMWARMGANQIAKCSEALALRKAFPQDLSGIYIDEEMGQADQRADEAVAAAAAPSQRVSPPRAGQVVVDGEVAAAGPAPEVQDETGRDCAAWQRDIAALTSLEEARAMWRQAGTAVLARDCGGTALHVRLQARMVELKAAEDAAAAAEAPEDVPEGVGEPLEPAAAAPAAADGDGSMDAPLEGEVLDAAGSHRLAEPDAADLRRNSAQRRAVVSQLIEIVGAKEAMEAACEQEFGFGPDDVGTSRLREWLTREQRATTTAA